LLVIDRFIECRRKLRPRLLTWVGKPEVCNTEFRFGNAMGGTSHTHCETRNVCQKIRSESEWVRYVTRTGKQEVCDTEFRFENASEILEVCEVVE
jgi:hypothetical protein